MDSKRAVMSMVAAPAVSDLKMSKDEALGCRWRLISIC